MANSIHTNANSSLKAVRNDSNHNFTRRFALGVHEKYDVIRGFNCVIATLREEISKDIPIVSGHRIHAYMSMYNY